VYAVLRLSIYLDYEDQLSSKIEELEEAGYTVTVESMDENGDYDES